MSIALGVGVCAVLFPLAASPARGGAMIGGTVSSASDLGIQDGDLMLSTDGSGTPADNTIPRSIFGMNRSTSVIIFDVPRLLDVLQ